MDNIRDFRDLSNFAYDEYGKMFESFGVQKVPVRTMKFLEKQIKKYLKLYDKPLFKKIKFNMKVQYAIETEPHSWLWKLFHSDIQKRIDYLKSLSEEEREYEEQKEEPVNQVISTVPVIINPVSVPQQSVIKNENIEDDDLGL